MKLKSGISCFFCSTTGEAKRTESPDKTMDRLDWGRVDFKSKKQEFGGYACPSCLVLLEHSIGNREVARKYGSSAGIIVGKKWLGLPVIVLKEELIE